MVDVSASLQPRLSLFQPPPEPDEDSDRDPIDFLS